MLSSLTSLPRYAKTFLLLLVDGGLAAAALWIAIVARAGGIPQIPTGHAVIATAFAIVLVLLIGLGCGMYRSVTRFQTASVLKTACVGILCAATIGFVGWIGGAPYKALGLGAVFGLTLFAGLLLSRHAARWLLRDKATTESSRVAVYGAGMAGRQLVALLRQAHQYKPVIFIDDDLSLHGRLVSDMPVIASSEKGFGKKLRDRKIDEIFLAIPSCTPSRRRQILERLGEFPYRVRTVPNLDELANGQPYALADLREISVADLLGRDPVLPLPGLLERCVTDKVVLVTGGGGSIGSELCRQIVALRPSKLVVLDHAEFALYQIERELRKQATSTPECEFVFMLGSVTDRQIVGALFDQHRIDTVYHAAAYKHVPIVESNALEGVRNNVLGTWYVAQAAARTAVKHFILISSDKAVRPTNVMGATKRMAELVLQMHSEVFPNTVFSMVRFGNVLASSGSVVPVFKAQIEAGGPITLTHPDVTRYFMTISEAVQLVIQAGAMSRGGEVFVLDMGNPVKIKDLALRMIHLTGKSVRDEDNPHGDIAIDVVGLRPGEKLFEELLIAGEATDTQHPRIWQVREANVDALAFEHELTLMERCINQNPGALDVRQLLVKWVAGYGNAEPLRPRNRATRHADGVFEIDASTALSRPA